MLQRFLMMSVCLALVSLAGCGGGPEDKLVGEYVTPQGNRVLKITSNTMTFSYPGANDITVNYKVTGTDGNKVMVEASAAGKPSKTIPITVTDTGIEIDMDGTVEKLTRK